MSLDISSTVRGNGVVHGSLLYPKQNRTSSNQCGEDCAAIVVLLSRPTHPMNSAHVMVAFCLQGGN